MFGSGGLFGYYGLFRTTRLGKSTWYVTSRRNAVVIVTDQRTIVLSPDDPERFLGNVHRAAPQTAASRGAGRFGAPAFESVEAEPPARGTAIIGGIVGVGALAIAAAAMLYAPGLPGYTLTTTALAIHDRLYPVTIGADSVDVAHIRVVDIATDPDWRTTSRTSGFANAHYHSGWFRTARGQEVRMYRADGKRLALLPGLGDASSVLLEAGDPDALVRELRREWARG